MTGSILTPMWLENQPDRINNNWFIYLTCYERGVEIQLPIIVPCLVASKTPNAYIKQVWNI